MLNLNAKPQISIQVEKEGKLKDMSKPIEMEQKEESKDEKVSCS